MPRTPKLGFTSKESIFDNIHQNTESYMNDYEVEGIHRLDEFVTDAQNEKTAKLSTVVRTLGIIAALKLTQAKRGFFQKIAAFFTGKSRKENAVINKADNLFKKHNLGISSKDVFKGNSKNITDKVVNLADNDILTKEDGFSRSMMSKSDHYEYNYGPMDLSNEFEKDSKFNSKDFTIISNNLELEKDDIELDV